MVAPVLGKPQRLIPPAPHSRTIMFVGLALVAAAGLVPALRETLPGWAVRLPDAWLPDLAGPINRFLAWLSRRAEIGPFTVKEITRGLAAGFEAPLALVQGLLAKGLDVPLPGGGELRLAALPWWALTAALAIFGHWAAGRRAAALVLATCLYFLVLGLWQEAMLTLASVAIAVIVGAVIGVLLGAWAWRWPRLDTVLNAIYDMMQTLPVFSYLVPILLFFGFGPVAALIATVIYAMPPMARNTTLALRRLPPSVGELASMAGCSPRQRRWLVLLPAARQALLPGGVGHEEAVLVDDDGGRLEHRGIARDRAAQTPARREVALPHEPDADDADQRHERERQRAQLGEREDRQDRAQGDQRGAEHPGAGGRAGTAAPDRQRGLVVVGGRRPGEGRLAHVPILSCGVIARGPDTLTP